MTILALKGISALYCTWMEYGLICVIKSLTQTVLYLSDRNRFSLSMYHANNPTWDVPKKAPHVHTLSPQPLALSKNGNIPGV